MLTMLLLDAATNTRTVIKETIPLTFYIPVLVSLLTAAAAAYATIRNTRVTTQTQREMANLADRTAREFKEKDYKNDFYKKIIDKRLAAWEYAERFIEIISISRMDNNTDERFYQYFISGDEYRSMKQSLISLHARSFWLSNEYRDALQEFTHKLNKAIKEGDVNETDEQTQGEGVRLMRINDKKLCLAGKKYYAEFKVVTRAIMDSQSAVLSTLHNIESFLAEKGDTKPQA